MAQRKIPIIMNVNQPTNFSATVDSDNTITVYVGHAITFSCTYEPGGPPVTEAQLQTAELELYQDEDRSNRLGEDDEALYIYELQNIDTDANTFDLTFTLTDVTLTTNTTYYAYLVVEQG
ncbi:hypothetical protein F4Y93_06035 [Candidatus Poribacteria bacterium]|nr:hypothetical protein [Candidatus Poribacteria bacterium]